MLKKLLPLMTGFFWACNAEAHTLASQSQTFMQNLIHPFTGIDHLIIMITVGIWSAFYFKYNRKRVFTLPVLFLTGLLCGQIVAISIYQFAFIEPAIVLTILMTGLTISLKPDLRKSVLLPSVLVLGALHGHAHGVGLTGNISVFLPILGMLVGSALLLAAGVGISFMAKRPDYTNYGAIESD